VLSATFMRVCSSARKLSAAEASAVAVRDCSSAIAAVVESPDAAASVRSSRAFARAFSDSLSCARRSSP